MRKLIGVLNIRPEEVRLFILVFIQGILLYTSNVLLRTVCFALFLAEYDAQTLPYMYIGISIAATAASLLYLRLTNRFSLSQVLIGNLGFLVLTLIGCRVGLALTDASWLIFLLPIYFGLSNTLTMTAFWNLLGRIFNLEQGKRLFGMLTCSEHLATVLAGFMAPVLVGWMGSASLFDVAAVMMAGALIFLMVIIRLYRPLMQLQAGEDDADGVAEADHQPTTATRRMPRLDRYILLICSVFILLMFGIYLIDNIFYAQAEMQFSDENQLTNFLGIFWGWVGILSLVMQFFIGSWLLKRFGVRAVILITPLTLGVCTLLFVGLGLFTAETTILFWIAVIANLCRLILDATDSAAMNLLYQPLPPHQRTQTQTLVTGVIYPASMGAVGVLLLVLVDLLGLNAVQLAGVLLMVVAVWIVAAVLLGREYLLRLQEALAGQKPEVIIDRRVRTEEMQAVYGEVQAEVEHASMLLTTLLKDEKICDESLSFAEVRERLLSGLALIYDASVVREMRKVLEGNKQDDAEVLQQHAIMLEMLDLTLPRSLRPQIIPLLAVVPENRDTIARSDQVSAS